jgi:hypothetical protein
MDELTEDIILQICSKISVSDVIRLCATCHHLHLFKYVLLEKRNIELNNKINKSQWCRICNKKVDSNLYILFMCTCHNSENFPYYHTHCLDMWYIKKNYTFRECPYCNRRKPLLICTKFSACARS